MMSPISTLLSEASALLRDRSGNFGMVTAILVPVLVGAASLAIDVSNIVVSQRQLQEASDSAALAAATALKNGKVANADEAKALAKDFVAGQMSNFVDQATVAAIKQSLVVDVQTTVTSNGTSYKINVNSNYALTTTPLSKVFGYSTFNVAAGSTTTSGVNQFRSAVSMTLVLDESGSMLANTGTKIVPTTSCQQYNTSGRSIGNISPCYVKKIDALKSASNLLLDELDEADPKAKFVRTNAIAWSGTIQDSNAFSWGTAKTRTQVINTMSAGGNTESAAPMKKAYEDLITTNSQSETEIQKAAGNTSLTKYIVFMTDGENNASSSDTSTLKTCTSAKTDGIKIYSIAFMAPDAGQKLLEACSSGTGFYFKAESMKDLLDAFQKIGEDTGKDKTLLTN
ncbi:pilus assembly protein TadG-related protein [Rhizobium sp. 21-4511-3d]